MSSLPNEHIHEEHHLGHLREEDESQRTPVGTQIKVLFGQAARKFREDSRNAPPRPEYEIHEGEERKLHPWLEAMAMGRHYFEW